MCATTSANGAFDAASSEAGASPKTAALAAMYTTAAISTPDTVAIGTLRSGFSTTAAATEALSSPVNAQNTSTSDCGTTAKTERPLTFHDPRNRSASNQNHPAEIGRASCRERV